MFFNDLLKIVLYQLMGQKYWGVATKGGVIYFFFEYFFNANEQSFLFRLCFRGAGRFAHQGILFMWLREL